MSNKRGYSVSLSKKKVNYTRFLNNLFLELKILIDE